jgi:DNA-directed RNA polymerase subunit RPC12/RpoP
MYRSVVVELALRCARCAGEVPLGTISDQATCGQCQHPNAVPWGPLLEVQVKGETIALEEALRGLSDGHTLRGSSQVGSVTMHFRRARCRCGEVFTDEQIRSVNRLRRSIACARCAATTPARTPPEGGFGAAHPSVVYVIGESAEVASSPRTGVVIKCGDCGANLELAGESAACGHCGATNRRPPGAGAIGARHPFAIVFRL